MWDLSSRLLQQSAAAALYLGRGVSPYLRPPDLERGIAPLGPPAPVQPLLLGRVHNSAKVTLCLQPNNLLKFSCTFHRMSLLSTSLRALPQQLFLALVS